MKQFAEQYILFPLGVIGLLICCIIFGVPVVVALFQLLAYWFDSWWCVFEGWGLQCFFV